MSDRSAHTALADRVQAAATHTHSEAGEHPLDADCFISGSDLSLRTLRLQEGTLRGEAIVTALKECVDTGAARVQGDLTVQGSLHAAKAPQATGGILLGRAQAGAGSRVFTCTSGIEGKELTGTTARRWASMDLPNLGPGRWLMLLQGGLGWRFGYTTDDVRISAVVSVRLSLPEEAGLAAESVLLPLHPHGEHTQALAQAQDYASWHKIQAAQSYTGFVVYALSRGALPTTMSPHLHPPTWPGSLSLSCVYPAPQRASTLELLLDAPSSYGAFWGRCILQAVFLPKGGVA